MENYFITSDGIKVHAITTEQMIEIDRIVIEEGGPNLYQMMENAGRNLSLTILDAISNNSNTFVLILAGTGGNGGGGICAARHLLNRGVNVKVAITNIEKLSEVPQKQLEIFKNAGGIVVDNLEKLNPSIIVDSIIGYSLTGTPRGESLKFIKWANTKQAKKISLDVPSGVDSTTGKDFGIYFNADLTMTLALPKTGLHSEKCGKLFLADIGISKNIYDKIGTEYNFPFRRDYVIPLFYKD